MLFYLIITLAPSPIPRQPDSAFDIISLGVDAVLCHDQDTGGMQPTAFNRYRLLFKTSAINENV